MKKIIMSLTIGSAALLAANAQDPDFHIYLCIGQSNMEGNAAIEPIDRQKIPENFKMMACVNFNNPARTQGEWYQAMPPLVREGTGLTPMDYFGRTMVRNLPENVKIGVVPVAIGGCRIEHLDKDFDPASVAGDADWFRNFMAAYNNYPYGRLIECAKKAQQAGVIKGILLHQGESNNCDAQWPVKVKKVYEDILADLNLNAEDVPLLAGEVVTTEQGGVCGTHNAIIRQLPQTIPTAKVISSGNLPQKGDGLHFTAHGYRVLGCRYAVSMLNTMGIEDPVVEYKEDEPFVPNPDPGEGDFVFTLDTFNPSIWEKGSFDAETGEFVAGQYGFGGWEYSTPIDLSGYQYIVAELNENETNGVEFKVFDTASYWEIPYAAKFNGGKLIVAELNGMMKNLNTGITPLNTKNVYRVGFWAYGGRPIMIKHVFATNNDPYNTMSDLTAGESVYNADTSVYNTLGAVVASDITDADLKAGLYIYQGKKYMVK